MSAFRTSRFSAQSRWMQVAFIAVFVSQAQACATMARGAGRTQEVAVTSTPDGALVFIGTHMVGVTPVRLDLERRNSRLVLRLEKEGFTSQQVRVTQSLSGWLAFDLFPLNPYICQGLNSADQCPTKTQRVGALALTFGVDFLTGAAYKLPPVVHATLTPAR